MFFKAFWTAVGRFLGPAAAAAVAILRVAANPVAAAMPAAAMPWPAAMPCVVAVPWALALPWAGDPTGGGDPWFPMGCGQFMGGGDALGGGDPMGPCVVAIPLEGGAVMRAASGGLLRFGALLVLAQATPP